MAGPPSLPDDIAQPLGRMVAGALARPELRRRLKGNAFDAAPLARAEFTAFLRRKAETHRRSSPAATYAWTDSAQFASMFAARAACT
ncbi:MAG: hypothetical protein IRZ13_16305 [Acetobacteraceae bacterium]|nr:hypothetical protein [Acetobacteraceae bacterium]